MKISQKIGMALGLAALGFSGCKLHGEHRAKCHAQKDAVVAEQPLEGAVTEAFKTGVSWLDDGITAEEAAKIGMEVGEIKFTKINFAEKNGKYFLEASNKNKIVGKKEIDASIIGTFVSRANYLDRELLEKSVKQKDGLYVVELGEKKYVCVNELGINITDEEAQKYGMPAVKNSVTNWVQMFENKDGSNQYVLMTQTQNGAVDAVTIDEKLLESVNAKVAIVSNFYKQRTMIKDPASGELVPKAAYDRALALSQLRDNPQGNVYTFTVKQLEEIAGYKDVAPGDKIYVARFVDELKKGFAPMPDGREPIAYKAVAEYLDVVKKLDAENIPLEIEDLVKNAEVVFVEGGRCEFEVRVKDGKELIYSKKMNVTPSRYYGGNIENRVIKAAESAGY